MSEGAESKCQSVSVAVQRNPTALGGVVGIFLAQDAIHLAVCHTAHLLESGEPAVVGADLQKSLGLLEYIVEKAYHTPPPAERCNMGVMWKAYLLCLGSSMAHRRAKGSATWSGTDVLHTDDQRLSVAEVGVDWRSCRIVEWVVFAHRVKRRSVSEVEPERSVPRLW